MAFKADVEAWHEEQRQHWARLEVLLEEKGDIMTALDDLKAAVADNQTVADRVATLIDTLQDQVTALQATIDGLIASGNADLEPLVAQVQAITAELAFAEAPNTPAESPVEPPMDM